MNSGIIEIIGPPGIGKSTIYKALCKTWTSDTSWIYPDVLLTPKPHFLQLKNWVEYNLRKLSGNRKPKTIPVEYGLRFANNRQELANFCWNHLSNIQTYGNNQINKRFRSAYFLFEDFCRYQAIIESSSTKPCVIHEGFLQKSFLINDNAQFTRESLSNYLPLLPLPRAVIYIDTSNKNVILERLRNRKKIIASQFGKDDKSLIKEIERWQYVFNIIFEKLNTNNVSVLKIDGERPLNENVSRINALLKKID